MEDKDEKEKLPVRWLTISESCKYLNMARTTFWDLARKANIPRSRYHATGKDRTSVRFDINDLDQFMISQKTIEEE